MHPRPRRDGIISKNEFLAAMDKDDQALEGSEEAQRQASTIINLPSSKPFTIA